MNISSKRAEYIALTGLVLSIVFFAFVWIIGALSRTFAVSAVSFQILGGALIWFILVVIFHQRSLAEQEKLDMAQLAKSKSTDTIFQAGADRTALFAVAQKRLIILEKWFVPIFAAAVAVFEISIGVYFFSNVSAGLAVELKHSQLAAVLMVAVAFISFLISRYATGLSVQIQWKPLRAGGSYLLATAILCFALSISLVLAQFKMYWGLIILSWLIPVLLIVLGVEIALNAVLDIYRPRIAGRYSRSSFDSRLLGLFNEPGGILRTFASAIDYQFGFKVSQTWFYKLLEKAIVPLALFSIVALYSLSCIVIVGPGYEAIIEHFGSFSNDGRQVGPGLTFKLPWPFDIAYKYPTEQIQQVNIGFVEAEQPDEEISRRPLLWGEKHYKEEYDLLVATKAEAGGDEEGAVPVSLVRAAVPVQYKIKDLYAFIYNHADAEKMLESICYREVIHFASSAKVEIEDTADGKLSLLGAGRKDAAKVLTERIQAAADSAQLGVKIVFLGLQGVHPPPDIAEDYQKVIGAVQQKQASILTAVAERNKILASLSGSVSYANYLSELADEYQQARESGDSEKIESVSRQLSIAFGRCKGDIFKTLSHADSYAFERAVAAQATGRRFNDQLLAYRASPEIYKRQVRLAMLEEALEKARKYVVVADNSDMQVYIVDLTEKLTPGLYDMELGTFEEGK